MDEAQVHQEFEQYLRRRFPERRTWVDYTSDIRQFRKVCQKDWRAVDMHDIDRFVDQQRASELKSATVRRRVAALKTFFDYLAEESGDMNWANPVRFKRHAGKLEKRVPRDLHDAEIERIWQGISSARDRAWFALMVRAGMRVGEVVALELADLLRAPEGDKPARIRVQGKGRKERIVLLSADAYAVLSAYLAERGECGEQRIFLNERGQPLKANGIEWLLGRYGQAAGLHVTPHQLRHSYARQLTEAGMPITSLGKLLGHSQISTTQIYTSGADPKLAEAYQVAMQRVEQAVRVVPSGDLMPAITPTKPIPVYERPEKPTPNWEAWATHLPTAIREASLAYIKHGYYTWQASKRNQRAKNLLTEIKNLWDWFLAYRPFTEPGQVGLKDLWAYQSDQQDKGLTAGTINRRMDYVLGILRQLAEQNLPIDQSVFRLRYLPRPESLPKHLSAEEASHLERSILQNLATSDYTQRLHNACLLVMLHSGLRAGECADLHIQDLDLPAKRLIIRSGKGQRDRLVYLSESACLAIRLYLQANPRPPQDFLWRQKSGNLIAPEYLRRLVAGIGAELGIDHLHPHRLRHTCATRLLNAGMDIRSIQKLLGHDNLATTMIYARVQDATLEADYHRFSSTIERQSAPLSNSPILAEQWPFQSVALHATLDDSI